MGVETLIVTSAAGDFTGIIRHKPIQTSASSCRARISSRRSSGLRQRRAMRLDFPNGFDDMVDIPAVGQEQILGERDRRRADLPIPFQLLEALAPGFQPTGAEETFE